MPKRVHILQASRTDELNPANTATFDLETTNLRADYGIILCGVVKPLHLKPRIFRLDTLRNGIREEDKRLVKAIIDELNRYDFLISYNGIRFDLNFLHTRALYHQIDTPDEKFHFDVLKVARQKLRLSSRRLDTVSRFLGVEDQKTSIEPRYWRWAMMGDEKAMDYIVEHCVQDCKVLEEVYERLKGYKKSIQRI